MHASVHMCVYMSVNMFEHISIRMSIYTSMQMSGAWLHAGVCIHL